jgi:activator of 2-hydroxyglutaryl-CoA dehydratase
MAIEKWLAVTSLGLFAMFAGEMISIYYFMTDVPEALEFSITFDADPKIFQFISIGAAPAGILAAVPYIMTKRYGSKPIGGLIIGGGVIMFVGMVVCYSLIDKIDDIYITDVVTYSPVLFMVMSAPVVAVGAYLSKEKKRRPKKEFF